MNKLLSKIKGHFRKPELEFDKPLTSADVVRMFKEKQFNGLKKLMPQFNWGGKRLSRSKSALVILGFIVGIGLFGLTKNPLFLFMGVAEIVYGSIAVFNATYTSYVRCVALDSTHFVVIYAGGNAIIGTVDGTSIEYGDAVVFDASMSLGYGLTKIDATHFAVAYADTNLKVVVGTVANVDEISFGDIEDSENAALGIGWGYIDVDTLDSTHLAILYRTANGYGNAIIATIANDDEVSFGTLEVFNSASSLYFSVTTLDSTHFVAVCRDYGHSSYASAWVGTVSSGDELAFGNRADNSAVNSAYIHAKALSSTRFVIAFRYDGSSHKGYVAVGNIDGTTITFGSNYEFYSGLCKYIGLDKIDSTHFLMVYNADTANRGSSCIGSIENDDEASFGTNANFQTTADSWYNSCSFLDSTHFVVAYRDVGDTGKGTAIIGTYTAPVTTDIKSWNGVAIADIKSINGISISSIKSINGLE